MTKTITMKLPLDGSFYHGSVSCFNYCAAMVKRYFDVDGDFELHISDRRPLGDEYYTVVNDYQYQYGGSLWRFWDVNGDNSERSPWDEESDAWASKNFPDTDQIYVWAMQ